MALQTVIPPTDISAETLTCRLLNEGWTANNSRQLLHLCKAVLLGTLDYKRYLASLFMGGGSVEIALPERR